MFRLSIPRKANLRRARLEANEDFTMLGPLLGLLDVPVLPQI
jgi:hypothetical protein